MQSSASDPASALRVRLDSGNEVGLHADLGSDALVANRAWTRFWLFGLVPVAHVQTSFDLLRSAAFRSAMKGLWGPASLLPQKGVQWEQVGPDKAGVRIQSLQPEIVVEMTLSANGSVMPTRRKADEPRPLDVLGSVEGDGVSTGFVVLDAHHECGCEEPAGRSILSSFVAALPSLPALSFLSVPRTLLELALTALMFLPSAQAAPADPAVRSPLIALSQPVLPHAGLVAALASLNAGNVVSRSWPQVPVMQELYRGNGLQPLWIKVAKPSESAWTAHARLVAASLHGLSASDYKVGWIGERLAAMRDATSQVSVDDVAQLDVTITLALLRYLADLHHGRAAKRQVAGKWVPSPGFPDVAALLEALPDPLRLQKFMETAAPAYPIYRRLLQARATYEALIAARREAPQLVFTGKIEPGGTSDLLPPIAARLIELGDLAASATLQDRYEGVLVDAVKRFQRRHGLADDGVVGKRTLAALQTSNRQRLRQIDLALERLRWLPPLVSDRVIGINIPDFRLRAFARDSGDDNRMKQALQSRVVAGREGRTPTPVFIAQLSAIDFSPYWNVPLSIARGELLPRLRRDPEYLARQEMEFVAADGHTVSQVVSPANLAAVERGAMRIRQRPGQKNALGNVKFTMPNSMNIYLHDTPSRSLFAESRRDFSHGCIRVEEPFALAQWALSDDPAWDETAIRQAMGGGKLRVVRLAAQIPVVVFYTTATVDEDGTLRFLPDIYGYDKKLDAEMPMAP